MEDKSILSDNEYFSKVIKEKIGLKRSPVAIKFALKKEDIPENIDLIDKKIRHCEMVNESSLGAMFYATANEQLCKGGSSAIGLEEAPLKVKNGETYFKLGRFKSIPSAKRTMDSIPKIDLKSFALVYAPLEKANFQPDIVVLISNPKQAMVLSQASLYSLGGKIGASFSGIQSICGDAVAGPFNSKEPNITLGCSGSRSYADIKDDEVIMGINGENLGCFVNGIEAIT